MGLFHQRYNHKISTIHAGLPWLWGPWWASPSLSASSPRPPLPFCSDHRASPSTPSNASATAGMVSSCPQTCPAGLWENANYKQEYCHLCQAVGIEKVSHHQQVKHLKTNENKSTKCCKSVHSECLCACVSIYLLHLHGRGKEEIVHTRVMQTVYFFFNSSCLFPRKIHKHE